MTRFLLDTNIISDTIKPRPSALLLSWLSERETAELFTSSLVIAELQRGILECPAGKRRRAFEEWFEGREGPLALLKGRILVFDENAAIVWARLMAEGRAVGRPRKELDTIIAATAIVNRCVVVTANERDFAGVDTFNPLAHPL